MKLTQRLSAWCSALLADAPPTQAPRRSPAAAGAVATLSCVGLLILAAYASDPNCNTCPSEEEKMVTVTVSGSATCAEGTRLTVGSTSFEVTGAQADPANPTPCIEGSVSGTFQMKVGDSEGVSLGWSGSVKKWDVTFSPESSEGCEECGNKKGGCDYKIELQEGCGSRWSGGEDSAEPGSCQPGCTCPHGDTDPEDEDCSACVDGRVLCGNCGGAGMVYDMNRTKPCEVEYCENGVIRRTMTSACTACAETNDPDCVPCAGTGFVSTETTESCTCNNGYVPDPDWVTCTSCEGGYRPCTASGCSGGVIPGTPGSCGCPDCGCACRTTNTDCTDNGTSATIKLIEDCPDDNGGQPTSEGSLLWRFSMGGKMPDGNAAGTLRLHLNYLVPTNAEGDPFSMHTWQFASASSFAQERVSADGRLRQIFTPTKLCQMRKPVGGTGHSATTGQKDDWYMIEFFRPGQVQPNTGRHSLLPFQLKPDAVPYRTFLVYNPDEGAALNWNDPRNMIIEERFRGRSASQKWHFRCSDVGNDGIGVWEELQANGLRYQKKAVTEPIAQQTRIEEELVRGQGSFADLGPLASHSRQEFSFHPAIGKLRLDRDRQLIAVANGESHWRTTSYSYYEEPEVYGQVQLPNGGGTVTLMTGNPGGGKVKSKTFSDGSWERYTYTVEVGGVTYQTPGTAKTYRPWLNEPAAPADANDTNCKVTVNTYNLGTNSWFEGRLDKTEEFILGKKVSSVEHNYYRTENRVIPQQATALRGFPFQGEDVDVTVTLTSHLNVVEDGTPEVGPSTSSQTTSVIYTTGDFTPLQLNGRPVLKQQADGTVEQYQYNEGTWNAATSAFVSTTFQTAETTILGPLTFQPEIAPRAWRTITYRNAHLSHTDLSHQSRFTQIIDEIGNVVRETEDVPVAQPGPPPTIVSHWRSVKDTIHRYSDEGKLIATIVNGDQVLAQSWEGDLLKSRSIPAEGTSYFTHDGLGRVTKEVRTFGSGPGGAGGDPLVSNQNLRPAITTEFTLDAAGRILSTTTTAGTLSTAESRSYDLIGRPLVATASDGGATSYAYDDATRTTTVTHPGGGTTITTRYRDGQHAGTSGTAAQASTTTYSVSPGGLLGAREARGTAGERWHDTFMDHSGRRLLEISPSLIPTAHLTTTYRYNDRGLVVAIARPGQPLERREYDPAGHLTRSAMGAPVQGVIQIASTYPVTDHIDCYERRSNNELWHVTGQRVYPTNNSGTAMQTLHEERIRGPFDRYEVTTLPGNRTSTRATVTSPSAFTVTSTASGSTITGTSQRIVRAGLVVSERSPHQSTVATYGYDALGRRTQHKDPRTGLPTKTTYDTAGRVASTEDEAGRTTTYTYYTAATDAAFGRLRTVTPPAVGGSRATHRAYDAHGRVTHEWGPGTYPVAYTYATTGEMLTMRTFQADGASWSGDTLPTAFATSTASETQWAYHAATGLLLSKTDALGQATTYSYDPASLRLATRSWARRVSAQAGAAIVTTTYSYTAQGQLAGTRYNDGTPAISYTYTRDGRVSSVTDAAGTRSYKYDSSYRFEHETISQAGAPAMGVAYTYDSANRVTVITSQLNGATLDRTDYTYRATDGALATVSHGGRTATYSYQAQSLVPDTLSIPFADGRTLTGDRSWDASGRLTGFTWTLGNSTPSSHTYTLDDAGRRTRAARADGTRWDYGYDSRSQVTSAAQADSATGTALPGAEYGYAYDPIGNRSSTTRRSVETGQAETTSYTSAQDNRYTARTHPQPARRQLAGTAAADAILSATTHASGTPATDSGTSMTVQRTGTRYAAEASQANTPASAGNSTQTYRRAQITASLPGAGVNGAALRTTRTGHLWFPPGQETFTHDADGNLTSDARWTYRWDAENRLVQMQTTPAAVAGGMPHLRLSFAYDHQSRRIRKLVEQQTASAWTVTSDSRFLYNGWNLIAELAMSPSPIALRTYAWGLDVSGTPQGAGGVGGLIFAVTSNHQASTTNRECLTPTYDGNGNITAYLHTQTGQLLSTQDYDAFGNPTLEEEAEGYELPSFKFSTKYTDAETGLVYYGYRYYSAEQGRWLNRDPIGERGGVNLNAMVANDVPNRADLLGAVAVTENFTDPTHAKPERPKVKTGSDGKPYGSYTGHSGSVSCECDCDKIVGEDGKKKKVYKLSCEVALQSTIYLDKKQPDRLGNGRHTLRGIYGHEQRHILSMQDKVRTQIVTPLKAEPKDEPYDSEPACNRQKQSLTLKWDPRLQTLLQDGDADHKEDGEGNDTRFSPVNGEPNEPLYGSRYAPR